MRPGWPPEPRIGRLVLLLLLWLGLGGGGGVARANNQFGVFINEIVIDPAGPDAGNQYVELVNAGPGPVDLLGWSICTDFHYRAFPAGARIPPFQTYLIYLGRTGVSDTATTWNTGPYVTLGPSGSFGLYHSVGGFTTPANLEDFIQWGSTGQDLENVGLAAGLWSAGLAITPGGEGSAIAFTGLRQLPHVNASYCVEVPTPGALGGCTTIGVAEAPPPPVAAFGAAPNPFRRATRLSARLTRAADDLTLDIYNLAGARVRRLQGGPTPAGDLEWSWDGTDSAGRPMAAGLYFAILRGGGISRTTRLILLP